MKFLIILFLTLNLYAKQEYDFESKFGFLSVGTILSNFKDARVVLKKWLDNIAVEYNGKVDVFFYSDSKTLYKDFNDNKLNMIVLEMPFYFENKKEIKEVSNNYWSLASDEKKYKQYYFLAHKSLNAKNFKMIKNKTLSIKNEEPSASTWVDKNSLLQNKSSYKKILKNIKYEDKESRVLLNVFFKKTDFAVISSQTWNTMIELNPSIKKKVEIISKSKRIHLPFIGLFKKESNHKEVAAFFSLSEKLKTLSGAKQIISLLKFDTIFRVEDNNLKELEDYYDEYFKLKNKYK